MSCLHIKVDNKLIPNGGTVNDASVRAEYWIRPAIDASAFVPYEQWQFPLRATGLQKNASASLQVTYWPQSRKH